MRTRRIIFSSLLLIVATMFNAVFAQSAEEAAKYGQLQEIQVPAAGKLGKYIKKKDSNVTAVKISGELNAKDWDVLFSLPNVAYLDLQNVTNVASVYKFKDNQGYHVEVEISEGQILLNLPNTLKFLAVPQGAKNVLLPDDINYTFDMLVLGTGTVFIGYKGWYGKLQLNEEFGKDIKFTDIKVTTTNSIQDANPTLIAFLKEHYARQNATTTSQCDPEWLNERIRKMEVEMGGNGIVGYVNSKFSQSIEGRINDYTNCKTLYIQGDGQYCNCDNIYPEEIVIQSTGDRILRQYTGNAKRVDLSDYSYIYAYAFKNSTVEIVNTGDKITIIPEYCFLGCKNLKKITMPAVNTIRSRAFQECSNLTTISIPSVELIEPNAFAGVDIQKDLNYTYKVPADVLNLDLSIFVNTGVKIVDLSEHPYAPDLSWNRDNGNKYEYLPILQKNTMFLIPPGARSHRYNAGDWQTLRIKEIGAKTTYTCKLDSIGSLKHFITDDIAENIESLTLNGVMDETEFELIKKCKNLKYLDMSHCFTFASVEVAKNKAKAELAFAQLVALASGWDRQQKELQHANHEISTEQLQQAQVRDYFIQNSGIDDISMEDVDALFGNGKVIPNSECYFPDYALIGLWQLEEIKFPRKLLKLELKNLWDKSKFYTKLKKVTFSNELKFLGDHLFEDAAALQEVNFPDSLQYVGVSCFRKAGLKKVDLSNTQIKFWSESAPKDATNMLFTDAFYNCPLTEFRSPIKAQYPKKWYEDQWIKNDKPNEVVMYMNMPEPFCNAEVLQGLLGRIKEIHIPRGMKAAWRGYPNVIDDIDLGE